ncbi:flagellin lysine-N-methylase [Falcatimonas sp. MSJ-15]|uniref:flagellin lysine-N-methylase n=1 Tax=Falcatimonas sp. MSJ-15 TaxID=2841515 RepID=UPI001C100DFF|nr:flagellin lysine-N-methylase [Falcatimonas sp. MSJ-15]
MKIRVPDYYKDFKCIADKCEDTCCAGWEVDVDDDSYEYYKTVTGPFGDRIKSVMVPPTEEEEACFTLNNGRCPFLNDNNLCDLYTELGEDKLCDTCTNYPRFIEEYGSLREIGIALSCKTAGELILKSDKKVTFELTENDEMVSTYNDIDPELYMMLMASRKTAFDIAQNRDFDIVMRYCLVLEYAKDIQEMIDKGTLSKIMNIKNNYSNEEYLRERTKTFNILHNEEYTRYSYIYEYLKIFDDFEIINKSWTDMVNHEKEYMYEQSSNEEYKSRYNRFEQYYHEKEYEYEQLLVYFIFRYYLKAVNDDDVFSKVKMAVVSFLIIKDLDVLRFCDNEGSLSFEEQVDIMHIYSREIEHSYENFEKLSLMLSEDERFSYHVLISLLIDSL